MSASYFIAKYVEDPFRNETRNVGVIVAQDGLLAGKFVGERDDGVFDRRRTGTFAYPDVYAQWRKFWRNRISAGNLDAVLKGSTVNFYVEQGGNVTDVAPDSSGDVCSFLYELLVGGGPVAAFEWSDADDNAVDLASDISTALSELEIIPRSTDIFVRHPVLRNSSIAGQRVTHTPSFAQRNGHLSIMEYIDLSSARINKTKERAGWMAYMYSDIKSAEKTSEAISIYRPEINSAEQIEYAKAVLGVESVLINWADLNERNQFLDERKQIASFTY